MEIYRVEVEDNGDAYWYQNDQLHRLDGPAVICANVHKAYWVEGKLHRLDGPAIEYADGAIEYWIEGKQLTESEFKQRTKPCSGKKILVDGIEYTLS